MSEQTVGPDPQETMEAPPPTAASSLAPSHTPEQGQPLAPGHQPAPPNPAGTAYALLQKASQDAASQTLDLSDRLLQISRDRHGELPAEYLRIYSLGTTGQPSPDMPRLNAPITTMETVEGASLHENVLRQYPSPWLGPKIQQPKPTEALVARYADETAEEALERFHKKAAGAAINIPAQLGAALGGAMPVMTLGASNIPPQPGQGMGVNAPLLAMSVLKQIADASTQALEANAAVENASRTVGQQAGLALWPVTPAGALFQAVETPARAAIARATGPLVARIGERVVETMGARATAAVGEGVPLIATGGPQTGQELMQGFMQAMEAAGKTGPRATPFEWALNKIGARGISRINPSVFGQMERAMDRAAAAGVKVEMEEAGINFVVPPGTAPEVVEGLRSSLRGMKNAMAREGGIVTFKLSQLAQGTAADIAGMFGLTAVQAGASAAQGASPRAVGEEVLRAIPQNLLFPAAMRAAHAGALVSQTAPNLRPSGRVVGQRSPIVDPFRQIGPEVSNPPASTRTTFIAPPPGTAPEAVQALAKVESAYQRAPNLTIADSIGKTAMRLLAPPAPAPMVPAGAPPEATAMAQQAQQQAALAAQDAPEHLSVLADLAGHPQLANASRLLGVDIPTLLHGDQPGPWPLVRYAVALAEQAGSLEGYQLPVNPMSLPDLMGFAQQVLARNPSAEVGLPPELQTLIPQVPRALMTSPPAMATPASLPPIDRSALTLRDAPDESQLDSDPSALPKMIALLDAHSQGNDLYVAGRLVPSDESALKSSDPMRVNLYVQDGLIKAEIPNGVGDTVLVDVTHSLETAVLPEDANWTFESSLLSPIVLQLTKSGRLVIDTAATEKRQGAQRALREHFEDERGAPIDPFTQPGTLLEAAHQLERGNEWGAQAVLAAADRLEAAHAALMPTKEEVLAPANERQALEEWGERLAQHMEEGAKIAAAKVLAQEALAERRADTPTRRAFDGELTKRWRAAWDHFDTIKDTLSPEQYARFTEGLHSALAEDLRKEIPSNPAWLTEGQREALDLGQPFEEGLERPAEMGVPAKTGIQVTKVGDGYVVRGFHGTRTSVKHAKALRGAHLGTEKAAVDRLWNTDYSGRGRYAADEGAHVETVEVSLKKPWGSPTEPKREHDVWVVSNLESERQALLDQGIDSIFYVNQVEDPGQLSVMVLDPALIKVVDDRKFEDKSWELERESFSRVPKKGERRPRITVHSLDQGAPPGGAPLMDRVEVPKDLFGTKGRYFVTIVREEGDYEAAKQGEEGRLSPEEQEELAGPDTISKQILQLQVMRKALDSCVKWAIADGVTDTVVAGPFENEETARDAMETFGGPALMKVEGEGGEIRAVAGMDPRILEVLGSNLYSGDLGRIAIKEMVQNAADSLRALADPSKGTLSISVEPKTRTLTVHDDGIGMSPDVATKELVDIGGTYKPGTASSGGYGIAKVAIFSNAEDINIVTDDGTTQTVLTGSGSDWLNPEKGLKVSHLASAGIMTRGTHIEIRLKPDVQFDDYSAREFVQQFLGLHRLPFAIKATANGVGYKREDLTSGDYPAYPETKFVETVQVPGAKLDFYVSDKVEETTYCTAHVLNNGLPQFSKSVSLLAQVKLPSNITVDVRATASPDEPDYPFRPDREGLRATAEEAVTNFIRSKLATAASIKERNQYREVYNAGVPFKETIGETKAKVFDTNREYPSEIVEKIAADPDAGMLNWAILSIYNRVKDILATSEAAYGRAIYDGFGLGSGYYGVNVHGKYLTGVDSEPEHIFINPYAHVETLKGLVNSGNIDLKDMAAALSYRLHATTVHEIVHNTHRSHDESFAGALTRALDAAWHPSVIESVSAVTRLLEENDSELLKAITAQAEELVSVRTKGTDVLGKISTSFARPAQPPSPPGPPGAGSPGRGGLGSLVPSGGAGASQGMAPGAPGGGSGPDPAAIAREQQRLHAEALAYAAAGGSFSKQPKLFAALTPDEKYEAALARLLKGDVVAPRQLAALNPAKGGPSYWSPWKPTPAQQTKLQEAWDELAKKSGDRDKALALARSIAEQRGSARSEYIKTGKRDALDKIDREGVIPLDQLLAINPTDWKALAKKDPHIYAEFIAQFNRERSPLSRTAEQKDAVAALNLLEDAFQAILEDPEITALEATPPEVLKTRNMFEPMSATSMIQGMLARIGRPFHVLGPHRQVPAARWNKMIESGDWDRDVYNHLRGSVIDYQNRNRADDDFFDPLNRVEAYADEPIRKEISAMIHRAIWQGWPAEKLAKYSWDVPLTILGKVGTKQTISLAEWVPKIRAYRDAQFEAARKVLIEDLLRDQVVARKMMNDIEGEIHKRILKRAADGGTEVESVIDLPPEQLEALRSALRDTDEGDELSGDLSAMSFKELERTLKARIKGWGKKKAEIGLLERGSKYVENYTPLIYNRVKAEIEEAARTKSDPFLTQLARQNPDIFFRFLEERSDTEKPPVEDFFATNRLYNYGLNRFVSYQPRLTKVLDLIGHPDYPQVQRDYALEMVGLLKGVPRPDEVMFENQLREELLKNPSMWKRLLKRVKGVDADEVLKEWGKLAVPARPQRSLIRLLLPSVYTTFLNPMKTVLFNLAEISFALPELAKNIPDLLHGAVDLPIASAQALGQRNKEFWSRRLTTLFGRRGWYQYQSRATKAHVTDLVNEVNTHLAEVSRISKESGSAAGNMNAAVMDTIMALNGMKFSEAQTRTAMFEVFYRRALRAGCAPEEATTEAAIFTEYAQGGFHTAAWAPVFSGIAAKLLMPLQRYTGIRTGPYLANWRMLLEGVAGLNPTRKIGPAPQPEAILPPMSEQPPLSDAEREAWTRVSEPPAEHGWSFAASQGAAWRSLRYILAFHLMLRYVMWPVGGMIYKALRLGGRKAWDYVDPTYMRDASTIVQGLLSDFSNVAHYSIAPYPLTAKQRKDRKLAAARLAAFGSAVGTMGIAGPFVGHWLREQYKSKPTQFGAGGGGFPGMGGQQ